MYNLTNLITDLAYRLMVMCILLSNGII